MKRLPVVDLSSQSADIGFAHGKALCDQLKENYSIYLNLVITKIFFATSRGGLLIDFPIETKKKGEKIPPFFKMLKILPVNNRLVSSKPLYTRPPKTPGCSFLRLVQEGLFGLGVL